MEHIRTLGWLFMAALFAVFVLLAQGCAGNDDGFSTDDDDDTQGDDDDDTQGDDDDDDDTQGDDDDDTQGDDDDDTVTQWGDPVEHLASLSGQTFQEMLEVVTWGDRVAFCSALGGLQLYEAADPENPQLLDAVMFDVQGQESPRCQHLAVDEVEERIYVAAHADQTQLDGFLAVFDASDPNDLVQLGLHIRQDEVEGIAVADGLLLVAAHSAGLHLYERGDGAYLAPLHEVGGIGNAWTVHVAGDLAYVTDGDGQLVVVDFADPGAAAVVGGLELPGTPRHLDLDGDRAAVALGSAGIALVSLDDPRAPQLIEVEDTPGSALSVAVGDAAIYVADWNDIRVFDLANRDDAIGIGHEPLPLDMGGGTDSRTLGIAGRDDIILSSNWTEMVAYRYHADRSAPDIYPAAMLLALPDAAPGAPGVGGVSLYNHGTETLEITGVDAPPDVTVDALPSTLEPGESAWITVSVEPAMGGMYLGEFTILSNDPDQPELTLSLQANGAGLNVGDDVTHLNFVTRGGDFVDLAQLSGFVVLLDYFATF